MKGNKTIFQLFESEKYKTVYQLKAIILLRENQRKMKIYKIKIILSHLLAAPVIISKSRNIQVMAISLMTQTMNVGQILSQEMNCK